MSSKHWLGTFGAQDSASIGCRDDGCVLAQRRIGGKAKDIVEIFLRFAPGHDFGTRVMPVSAQQYPGFRPVGADATDQSPYMSA